MHNRTFLYVVFVVLLILPVRSTKVKVDFYGEALCPYCARFATSVVADLFANKVSDLMEFTYTPWGNAKVDPSTNKVSCQHGPQECILNTLLSCVIDVLPDQNNWFPVAECVEKTAFTERDVQNLLKTCLPSADIADKVRSCQTGSKGQDLQQAAYNKTQALIPPHQWVPWVVVNGVPLLDDYENLKAYICTASDEDRPQACYDGPATLASKAKLQQQVPEAKPHSWPHQLAAKLEHFFGRKHMSAA